MENRMGKMEGQIVNLQQDVSLLKSDVSMLKSDVSMLKNDVETKITSGLDGLRTEMHTLINAQTKWFAASQLALLAVGLGLARLIF